MTIPTNMYGAMRTRLTILVAAVFFVATVSIVAPACADDDDGGLMDFKLAKESTPLADSIEQSLDYLFDVLEHPDTSFDQSKISSMLEYAVDSSDDPKDIEPKRRFGGFGICLRKDVHSDLDKILRYFYNPNIPNFLLCPSVLRLSGWHAGSEFLQRKTAMWDELPTLDAPVLIRGREFEVNTPDSFAEAYYRYDLDRLLILLKYNGKNVLVSVTEQPEKSDVGRKGAILDDTQWDYFYSGLEGLNRGGIGWMDTFMYRSGSVQIFVEQDAVAPRSTVFLFKWLKAGWASMNVVKRKHIYDGALRYIRSFTTVLESNQLTAEMVSEGMKSVAAMDQATIDAKIKEYAHNFEIRFKDDPKMQKSEYAEIIENGGYAAVLDGDARQSILALQKLKALLGMETLVDLGPLPQPQLSIPESDVATVPAKPES
jgi:hypothetical protein